MGFFSWKCSRSGESVWNDYSPRAEERGIVEGWVILPRESAFQFVGYEGYGKFDVQIDEQDYELSVYSVAGLHYENPELSDKDLVKMTQDDDYYFEQGLRILLGKDDELRFKTMPRVVLGVDCPQEGFYELPPPEDDEDQGFFYSPA